MYSIHTYYLAIFSPEGCVKTSNFEKIHCLYRLVNARTRLTNRWYRNSDKIKDDQGRPCGGPSVTIALYGGLRYFLQVNEVCSARSAVRLFIDYDIACGPLKY